MILHTVLPDQAVLSEEEEEGRYQKQKLIAVDGHQLLVEPISFNEFKIVRLISSNPQAYLNPKYQPGRVVTSRPDFS